MTDYNELKENCTRQGIQYNAYLYFLLGRGEKSEDAEKHAKENKLTDLDGKEYDSLQALADAYDLTTAEFIDRLKSGYTLEEVLKSGSGDGRIYFFHVPDKGVVTVSKKELDAAGLGLKLVRDRIMYRGYTKEEALRSAFGVHSVETTPSVDPSWALAVNGNVSLKQNYRTDGYTRYEREWAERYQDVIRLAAECTGGDINQIRQYHNRQLYDWLVNQRCYRRQGRLKEAQIAMLDYAGFDWNLHFKHKSEKCHKFTTEEFIQWAKEIKPYRVKYGTCYAIPVREKLPDGSSVQFKYKELRKALTWEMLKENPSQELIDIIADAYGIVPDADTRTTADVECLTTTGKNGKRFTKWMRLAEIYKAALTEYHSFADIPSNLVGRYKPVIKNTMHEYIYVNVIASMNEAVVNMENGNIKKGSPSYKALAEVFIGKY